MSKGQIDFSSNSEWLLWTAYSFYYVDMNKLYVGVQVDLYLHTYDVLLYDTNIPDSA